MAGSSQKVILASLIGNGLIAVVKFIAATVTGSSAMLSEGIHSLVDTANQILLLLGLRLSRRPPDEDFPFGHGKEVYFWSFVVSILIFAVGAGVSLYEGIHGVLEPHPIENPALNYVVLAFAFVFEGAAWYLAIREFRRQKGPLGYLQAVKHGKDPSLFVVLFEDTAAMLGILVAFAGILLSQITGVAALDGFASVVIGLILGVTAAWLAIETKSLLIGESAPRSVRKGIRAIASSQSAVEHVNEILTMHMGPEFILVNLSVDFADESSAETIEHSVSEMDARIKAAHPNVRRVFVEAEARASVRGERGG